jgi:beta-lactamase regulating signal transducer with metallopeptidase domain
MLTTLAGLPASAADSARAAASVYTASLLATAPIVAAAIGAFAMRRAAAEGRVLVWRVAVVMLLVALAGRLLPLRLAGWSVPSIVAAPLVALGRIRVADLAPHVAGARNYVPAGSRWIQIAFAMYVAGVLVALSPTVVASIRARRTVRRARALDGDRSWMTDLEDSLSRLAVRRGVRLFQSRDVNVPMTWGLRHAVILLPTAANVWTADERRMVLRHELAHVRGADWAFGLAARFACALFWFHPGVWLIAGALRRDAERAADDRVISSGVARSDYAELLIAASTGGVGTSRIETALALSGRGPLRTRLAAILDVGREVRPLARRWTLVATAACAVSAVPLCGVEIVPTRDVLASLMRDSRWESRAYAVIGLAHRADTVAFARSAAELDPNPRVRAWARYALGLRPEAAPNSGAAVAR